MTVTIRIAVEDDLPAIVEGARAFAKQADVEYLMAEDISESVAAVVFLPAFRVYLAEADGVVVGGLGVSTMPYLWNMALIETSEHFFWVYDRAPKTTALALLRRVLDDAKAEKVNIVTFAKLPTSPKKLAVLYDRLGFGPVQESYMRVFSWQ